MGRWFLFLIVLALPACKPPKGVPVENMPAWRTPEGARSLKMKLLDSFISQGATQDAMTLIHQLRDDKDTDPELDLYQGMALSQEGFDDEAERILLGYEKKAPHDARVYKALALIYADNHQMDKGIAALQKAVQIDKTDAEAWNNLGFLLLSSSRYDEAIDALQKAVALDGTQARYRNNLGFALAAEGHWHDAFEAFQSVSTPEDAHYNLGVAYELQNKTAAALKQYQKAVQYDPNHEPSKQAIARLEGTQEEK